ncbi:MAG: phasin family protein [Burkholderiales bacterium]|nr:phasin family protein [Burkholderiales bacterium]
MQLNPEQFTAAQKANLSAVMDLTAKALEGIEQLATLNLKVFKTGIEEAAEAGIAALSAKDPQAFLALQAGAIQPGADRIASYGRQVYGIFLSTRAEVEKVAAEQATSLQQSVLTAFEAASKNVPEGSSAGIAFFKSAFAGTTSAFDSLQKAARQATDAAEANYTAATESVTKATHAAARTKRAS